MGEYISELIEEYVDELIYLVIGSTYFLVKYFNERDVEDQPTAEQPSSEHPLAPTSSVDPCSTWADEAQEASPVNASLQRTNIENKSPHPEHTPPTTQAIQQPASKKVGHVLRRYSGWKKAVIMSELIQPRY